MTRISIIVAMDENGLIGKDNRLPWRLPDDLKHFKRMTLGKPILMGRKTWESLGKPLPERRHLVMTRNLSFHADGVTVVRTLDGALRAVEGADELMVIGGAKVYDLALPRAQRLYVTRVHAHLEGDTRFPETDWSEWYRDSIESHPADDSNPYPYSFEVWHRLPHAA
jgi:dihydrofolate reductase